MAEIAIPPTYDPEPDIPIANAAFARRVAEDKAAGRRVEPSGDALRGILVEKCTFVNPRGYLLRAVNGRNVTFRDNTVEWSHPLCDSLPYAGEVRV
jgi:hypothetical protein